MLRDHMRPREAVCMCPTVVLHASGNILFDVKFKVYCHHFYAHFVLGRHEIFYVSCETVLYLPYFSTSSHRCSIHDHTDAHCFVKILQGELMETRYNCPSDDTIEEPLIETDVFMCSTNQVTYICGKFFSLLLFVDKKSVAYIVLT